MTCVRENMKLWDNRVVVVSGGSAGLGLEIAKSFHRRGSLVTMLARNNERLQQCVHAMNSHRPDSAQGICIDMSADDSGRIAVDQIVERQGRIDVWVNAVGQSVRIGFLKAVLADYRQFMEQNFFASVGGSLAALPSLEQSSGYLINIGSLASRTAWPFIAPYVTSKHALSGFAQQLRLEGPANVHYLFVCPGPIVGDEPTNRYQDHSHDLPEQAERSGAGAPVKAIDARWLSDQIIRACEKRKPELIVPIKSRLLFGLLQFWPSLGDRLIHWMSK